MKQTHQLRRLDQLGQFLTRIKHARFHRGLTDADYFGNLFDGFASVDHFLVNECEQRVVGCAPEGDGAWTAWAYKVTP